ncbi:hypothetical protein DL98DRAFT_536878 [Cadophora sp. DSE1049]|nr:hypothetical protein DL98DRAFT_536878 [Cadophora sp. DSE1049]
MSQYTSLTIDHSNISSSEGKLETQQEATTTSLASTAAIEELRGQKIKSARIAVWVALLINIIIICILTTAVFVPFKLTNFGILSSRTKSIYVTTLTILATLCAAFSSSQIRHLWLRHVDIQLASLNGDFSAVNSEWRTTLGVSGILEGLQRWHIMSTFLISGLITTAIVAGLSGTLAQS